LALFLPRNTTMKNIFLASFFALILALPAVAQKSEFGAMAGVSFYNGELNRKGLFKQPKFAFGGFYRHNFNSHFSTKICFLYGTVQGADSLSGNVEQIQRNLSFRSVVAEFSAQIEINFLPFVAGDTKTRFTPYIFGGFGIFKYNPKAYVDAGTYTINGINYTVANGGWYALMPLGTEGQGTTGYPDRKKYSLTSFSIPFGLGLKFNIANGVGLGLEWGMRPTFTDYLDDVSTTYAEPIVLRSEYTDISAVLSDRSKNSTESNVGRQRGNSTNKDWYSFAVVTLSYSIKTKLPKCAAYSNKSNNYKRSSDQGQSY
jgi:hypothetical protein